MRKDVLSPGLSQLSPTIRRILDQIRGEAPVSLTILADELANYTNGLDNRAKHTEFFDVETGKYASTLCHKLLAALPDRPSQEQHRLTQLAISYFVLEEDAEDDNESLIGFDDDLQVVVAVIEELGFQHLLEEGSNDG